MSAIDVKVGQVWKDKDKRRHTVIEILAIGPFDEEDDTTVATALVVGSEEERKYVLHRLQTRWELVKDVATYTTREEWLQAAMGRIREDIFVPIDITVPEAYVSIGWTKGRARHRGECWTGGSADKKPHVFIAPNIDTTEQILLTLTHEMIHVWDENKSAHKGAFAKVARQVGMIGSLTSSEANDTLADTLKEIHTKLGPLPHAHIMEIEAPVVQKTYMRKIVCQGGNEDMKLRLTKKMIEEYGMPLCGCHAEPMDYAEGEED